MNKIINPITGRWVSKTGRIGNKLIKSREVHTDMKKYKKVVELWDWWSDCGTNERHKIVNMGIWDTMLNDMEKGKYPFYIMSYEKILKKVYKVLK